ncbi:MAG: hypothetical protein QMD06_02245 [Candidatus Altarchaeum sp.]|nr:hypothetical protein [Candidatus Altarchaeum sp.]
MMFSEKTVMKNKILLFSFPSIVLLIALFWPYFSWYETIFMPISKTASLFVDEVHVPIFYSLSELLKVSLVLFTGAVILFKFFLNQEYMEKYKFIYYGAVSFILIYIIFGIFTITYGGIYLYFYIFFLHLAITVEFKRRNLFYCNYLSQKRNIINIILICIFLLSLVIQIGYTYAPHFVSKEYGKLTFHEYVPYKFHVDFNEYKFLENEVLHYDVILSDPQTSIHIPTYRGKVIYTSLHSSEQIFKEYLMKDKDKFSDTNERFEDIVFFFRQDTNKEMRKNVVDKYNISFVLINHNLNLFNKRTINEIENMGNVTYRSEYFTLVKVR